mmetsp:Transcript_36437/g.115935  ORF Transcript_36437/g.115935 Transcript_36437/m.115935 type:complete len:384 (-) Transcript_36437:2-1153(-)
MHPNSCRPHGAAGALHLREKAKLAPAGSIRSSAEFRRHPRLWIFPPSTSSGKAHMSLRLSAAWPYAEVREIDVYGENYGLDFCRLNPNMTVPVLEIEDKVISDSWLIADYLCQRYAGDGDCRAIYAGKGQLLSHFVALAASWDEALYLHGKRNSGRLVNRLRLARLRQRYAEITEEAEEDEDDEESTEGSDSCGPQGRYRGSRGGEKHLEAYVRKIAEIQHFDDVTGAGEEAGKALRRALQDNQQTLDRIFSMAEELLQGSPEDGFLLGRELTTADAFLLPVLCRVQDVRPRDMRRYLGRHPSVADYWSRARETEEAQVVLGPATCCRGTGCYRLASPPLLKRMVPCQLLGVRCGCVCAPDLPEEVEERIREAQAELRRSSLE